MRERMRAVMKCVNEPDFTVMHSDGSTSSRFITHTAILGDPALSNVSSSAVPCALTRPAVTAVSGAVCLTAGPQNRLGNRDTNVVQLHNLP